MRERLCVCGVSKKYPYCDESHKGSEWSCGTTRKEQTHLVISTSIELYNLAQRLAHKLDALVVTEHYGLPVNRLLRLCSLSAPYPTPYIQANQTLNIAIDVPSSLILKQNIEPIVSFINTEPKHLYKKIIQVIELEETWTSSLDFKSLNIGQKIFLSHAVVDQPRLTELVQLLRLKYHLDVFVCSDSLSLGKEWYSSIIDSLAESDLVVQIITENTNKSTFCAFEAGYSIAAQLPLLLICYDQDIYPPTHLQHIQASEIWKIQLTKPWMTKEEIALSVILEMIVQMSENHLKSEP